MMSFVVSLSNKICSDHELHSSCQSLSKILALINRALEQSYAENEGS